MTGSDGGVVCQLWRALFTQVGATPLASIEHLEFLENPQKC